MQLIKQWDSNELTVSDIRSRARRIRNTSEALKHEYAIFRWECQAPQGFDQTLELFWNTFADAHDKPLADRERLVVVGSILPSVSAHANLFVSMVISVAEDQGDKPVIWYRGLRGQASVWRWIEHIHSDQFIDELIRVIGTGEMNDRSRLSATFMLIEEIAPRAFTEEQASALVKAASGEIISVAIQAASEKSLGRFRAFRAVESESEIKYPLRPDKLEKLFADSDDRSLDEARLRILKEMLSSDSVLSDLDLKGLAVKASVPMELRREAIRYIGAHTSSRIDSGGVDGERISQLVELSVDESLPAELKNELNVAMKRCTEALSNTAAKHANRCEKISQSYPAESVRVAAYALNAEIVKWMLLNQGKRPGSIDDLGTSWQQSPASKVASWVIMKPPVVARQRSFPVAYSKDAVGWQPGRGAWNAPVMHVHFVISSDGVVSPIPKADLQKFLSK